MSDVPLWPTMSLLGCLESSASEALLVAGHRLTFRRGETLMMQGERGTHAILLLSGLVKVVVVLSDGREALLAVRTAGDLIGEMACLTGEDRSAAVTAASDVVCRTISAAALLALMHDYPAVAIETCRAVARRLRWANNRRVDLALRPAPERLGSLIVQLTETYGRIDANEGVLDIRLSQADLASLTGLSQRAAEKGIHDLRDADLISVSYRRIVIKDLGRLREFSGLDEQTPHWRGVL